jgi:hypothetical protein
MLQVSSFSTFVILSGSSPSISVNLLAVMGVIIFARGIAYSGTLPLTGMYL